MKRRGSGQYNGTLPFPFITSELQELLQELFRKKSGYLSIINNINSMITFIEQNSLFETEKTTLTWVVDGEKSVYSGPVLTRDQIPEFKNSIVREHIYRSIKAMVKQRKNAYLRSGVYTNDHFKSIHHLEYYLPVLKETIGIYSFFQFLDQEILSHLNEIKPKPDSRYFPGYNSKLNAIQAFCTRCINWYDKNKANHKPKHLTTA